MLHATLPWIRNVRHIEIYNKTTSMAALEYGILTIAVIVTALVIARPFL